MLQIQHELYDGNGSLNTRKACHTAFIIKIKRWIMGVKRQISMTSRGPTGLFA